MQNESIRQSLLLWVVYTKQLNIKTADKERIEPVLKKVEKYLIKAGITQVEIIFEILDFCTLKYLHEGTPKTEQFSFEELERAGYMNTGSLPEGNI